MTEEKEKTATNEWWIYAGGAVLVGFLYPGWTTSVCFVLALFFARKAWIAGNENEELAKKARKAAEDAARVVKQAAWDAEGKKTNDDAKKSN